MLAAVRFVGITEVGVASRSSRIDDSPISRVLPRRPNSVQSGAAKLDTFRRVSLKKRNGRPRAAVAAMNQIRNNISLTDRSAMLTLR
jgi:hypothetical protein